MSRKTKLTLAEEIDQLQQRGDACEGQLRRVGELLKMLAETMEEAHVGTDDTDYAPWAQAEYLADQIGAHTAVLSDVLQELERLSMRVGHLPTPPRLDPTKSPLTIMGGHDGDAA